MPKPSVLSAEQSAQAMRQGFNRMANLLAATLGPVAGNIFHTKQDGGVEQLTDAAVIARRIIELPDRAENVGAMLLRHLVWRVHQRAGDGAATTAVLAQAIFNEAFRYVQAGGNAMMVRRGVDRAARLARQHLQSLARPASGEETLTRVAQTITRHPELSLILGEMFDVLGPSAFITVEDYVAPYFDRAYFDGGRWNARLQSPYFITDPVGRRAVLSDPAVVLYAGPLRSLDDLRPLLAVLSAASSRRLLLVAHEISGEALSTLVVNHQKKTLQTIGVALRGAADRRAEDFADLATITGAQVIQAELGQTLASLAPGHLGRVRRAEAGPDYLVISGGGGDRGARQRQIEHLQAYLADLPETDEQREAVQERLARLAGGVGVLKVGASTKTERETLHQTAEKAIRALRLAVAEGVVPGGGTAYLQLAGALAPLLDETTGDERVGVQVLRRALEAPFRRIVQNRGLSDPSAVLAALHRAGNNAVYEAESDRILPADEAGLLDSVGVLRTALESAVSGAMVALTTGAVILHRRPRESYQP